MDVVTYALLKKQIEQNKNAIESKISKTGWSANKFLGTDENGNIIEKDVDYFTDADKQELVNDVLNALPEAEEVSY